MYTNKFKGNKIRMADDHSNKFENERLERKQFKMQSVETVCLSLPKNVYRFILVLCQVQIASKKQDEC